MNINSTVLQNMTPIKRKCFPLFSFMQFVAWLIPWPWACDLWIYSQALRETSSRGKPTILEAQTDESLLVSDNDLKYLTREEAEQIIERFKRYRKAMTDWFSGRVFPENGSSNGQMIMAC
jgi:hypothetical protein